MRDLLLYRVLPGMWGALAVLMFATGNSSLGVLFIALAIVPLLAGRRARAVRRRRMENGHDQA